MPILLLRAVLSTLVAFALIASPASAATTSCTSGPLSTPFAPWLDYFSYFQAPGGGFEKGLTGWKTSGGAKVVSGNEPWKVAGATNASSLYLPSGASVTSPGFCGGLGYPTVRLFYKGGGLPLLTNLRVEVLYTDNKGLLRSFGLGTLVASPAWAPSLPMLTLSGLPLLTGSQLAVRITAVGTAYYVDDVYVDPYSRH